MSNSKTDKIRERLEDASKLRRTVEKYGDFQRHDHENSSMEGLYDNFVRMKYALEAVVDECESSRYPVDRQSSLIDRLLNLIADELDVEES